MIFGVANSPIEDRERELITSKAMEDGIESFMKRPILHIDHLERPVGELLECRVLKAGDPVFRPDHKFYDERAKPGDTFYVGYIDDHPECDDVWDLVKSGKRNKISIFGVRKSISDECRIPVHKRETPCVTKALKIWSFSLVGENAINSASYIKIAKAISPDVCDDFCVKTNELIKAAFPDNSMVPPIVDSVVPSGDTGDPGVPGVDPTIKKSDDIVALKVELDDVKTGIAGILDFIKKASTQPIVDTPLVDPPVESYITKAQLEPVIDLIVKAKVELALTDIKKAYDTRIEAIETLVKAFGNETIEKAGHVVILDADGHKTGEYLNPFISNLEAMGDIE